ncbi:MAG: VanW family protein [Roseiflexaceae bacterium]
MRRRRGQAKPEPGARPLEPVTELLEPEDGDQHGQPPPSPRPPTRRPSRPSKRRSLVRLILSTLAVIGFILAVPYAVAFALPLFAGDRVPDGVSIQGQPVGGMSRVELLSDLESRYGALRDAPLTLVFEGQTWQPTLADLGGELDLERTADAALLSGAGDPIDRLRSVYRVWQGGLDLAPAIRVDTATLHNYLLTIAPSIEQPPRDAALSIASGKVLPSSARPGRQILIDETTIDILRTIQQLTPQDLPLRTRTLAPRIDDDGATKAIDDARVLLQSSLRLRQGNRDWVWDAERIASLITIRAEGNQLITEVDTERLARQVEKLAQLVDSGSSEPRVTFRDGRVQIVQPGNPGLRLNQTEAVEAIMAALKTDLHVADLPVDTVNPQVTEATLAELGISELVAEGRSSFEGSASYRVTNIKAGAQRMNGVLIPPGAEFSFNTQLGEVDEANGFVQGYAVIGNRTQLEWGGGVCQVSTTVFRAAFWGGLPITERHAHPFYISWYDAFSFPDQASPGMDATIFTGVQDFKFVNDTKAWMLMETEIDEASQVLTVRLYGTRPDRTVQVIGPEIDNVIPPPSQAVYVTDPALPAGTVKQTDRARKGMDIAVYRVIEENGVRKEPELFFTRFKSWPDVFVRGIGSP